MSSGTVGSASTKRADTTLGSFLKKTHLWRFSKVIVAVFLRTSSSLAGVEPSGLDLKVNTIGSTRIMTQQQYYTALGCQTQVGRTSTIKKVTSSVLEFQIIPKGVTCFYQDTSRPSWFGSNDVLFLLRLADCKRKLITNIATCPLRHPLFKLFRCRRIAALPLAWMGLPGAWDGRFHVIETPQARFDVARGPPYCCVAPFPARFVVQRLKAQALGEVFGSTNRVNAPHVGRGNDRRSAVRMTAGPSN